MNANNVVKFEKPKPKRSCSLCANEVEAHPSHTILFCQSCKDTIPWLQDMINDACIGEWVRNLPHGAGIHRMEACNIFEAYYQKDGKTIREYHDPDPGLALHDLLSEVLE